MRKVGGQQVLSVSIVRWTRLSGVDLHLHSTASDGRFSPEELVDKAVGKGLTVIAMTDHDSTDGIAPALEAAKAYSGLQVIPGVEINTDVPRGEVHILGYFVDYGNPELKTTLEKLRRSRIARAQGMIAKLESLGVHITWQRVKEIAGGGAIGRPHLAQALLEKGYTSSIREAFIKYIGRDGPAYVERKKIMPLEATELVLRAGGLPVLAHPPTASDPEQMIIELKRAGLVGIEVYYDDYGAEKRRWLKELADRYNLIATGGSDYHGLDDLNETLMGDAEVPLEAAQQLITLAQEGTLKPV